MVRLDFLRDCNSPNIPPEDFALQFCNRCYQKECSRSQFGKSRLEVRNATWEDRLFLKPLKLDENDPLFRSIRAKKFLEANNVPEIGRGTWDAPPSEQESHFEPQGATIPEESEEPAPDTDRNPMAQEEAAQPEKSPPAPEPLVSVPVTSAMNTQFQNGKMLSGKTAPSKTLIVAADPWAAPDPVGKIVKAGAKIRLG